MPTTPKVGIYAGSFDPIHEGHIAFANAAIRQCGLEKVFFLVEPRPRRKQGVRAMEHRLEMVRLAIAGRPEFGQVVLEQARFTVDKTIPALQARFRGAEIHLLMGDDVLGHLGEWPNVDSLTQAVSLIVAVRRTDISQIKEQFLTLESVKGVSFHYNIVSIDLSSVSSTLIRAKLRKNSRPEGLSDTVHEYIRANGLYGPSGH